MSWVLLAVQAVVSILHLFPNLVYRPNPRTARVVEFVNSLGPWWAVGFGLSSVVLFGTLVCQRFRHVGHGGGVFTWVWFSAALWFGAVASTPTGPILFACVATGLVAVHWIMASAWAEQRGEGLHR